MAPVKKKAPAKKAAAKKSDPDADAAMLAQVTNITPRWRRSIAHTLT